MTLNLGNPNVGGQFELPAVNLWLGLRFGARRDSAHEHRHRAQRPDSLRESPHSPPHSVQVAVANSRRVAHWPKAAPNVNGEPPRFCRRLHDLRGWSHGTTERVLTGGAGAGGAAGVGAAGRARLAMGGDRIDRGEDRVYGRDAAEVGAAARRPEVDARRLAANARRLFNAP